MGFHKHNLYHLQKLQFLKGRVNETQIKRAE